MMELEDHGVHVRIAVGASIGTSVMILCARAVSRWPWRFNAGNDDFAAIVATVLSLAQGIIVVQAALRGLGLPTELLIKSDTQTAMLLIYVSNILFVVVLYISQLAITLTLHRLSHDKQDKFCANSILVATGVFALISIILVAAESHAPSAELDRGQSVGILARWATVSAMTGLLNIVTIAQAVYLLYNLQMKRISKFKVASGFGLRILLIPLSVARLITLRKALRNDNFLYDYSIPELLVQAEMCYAVVCATLPCLHPFLDAAQSGMLDLGRIASRTGGSTYNKQSYQLSSSSYGRGKSMGISSQDAACGISTNISTQKNKHDRNGSMADLIETDNGVIMVQKDIDVGYTSMEAAELEAEQQHRG